MNASVIRAAALASTLCVVASAAPAAARLELPRPSQKATVTQTVGLTDLSVVYSRPGVKGRVIWGDLVPYDQPWRTGANEATTFTCSQDVTVEGQPLPTGTYSLFTIPGVKEWTVVFNTQKDLWGAYQYQPEHDTLRVQVTPREAPHEEWMSFRFDDPTWSGTTLTLYWDQLAVPIRIDVNDVEECLAAVRDSIGNASADDWRTLYRGASFCLDAGVNLEEGAKWAERSVAISKGYYNTSLLARYRAAARDLKGAIALAEEAIGIGRAAKPANDTVPTERLLAEWRNR